MSKQAVMVLVVVVILVMFAPVALADSTAQFFHGVGVIFDRWTK